MFCNCLFFALPITIFWRETDRSLGDASPACLSLLAPTDSSTIFEAFFGVVLTPITGSEEWLASLICVVGMESVVTLKDMSVRRPGGEVVAAAAPLACRRSWNEGETQKDCHSERQT